MAKAEEVHVEGSCGDRISHLPVEVLEHVLSFLPIRDAVRTSILSSKWRHHWKTLPRLVFDDNCGLSAKKFVVAIPKILLRRNGPITKFILSIRDLESCPEVDIVVEHLSRKHVENLTLQFGRSSKYKLPSYFFSCTGLIHLSLDSCVLKLPPSFRGFTKLVTLNLEYVGLDANFLDTFIPKCPLLKELTLSACTGMISHYNIEAPRLEVFHLHCKKKIDSIRFMNTSLLASVTMLATDQEDVYDFGTEVFGTSLPALEQLHTDNVFLESIVGAGYVAPRLPTLLHHLTVLDIADLSFDGMDQVSALFCLIRSSPNLKKLKIQACGSTYVDNYGEINHVQDLLKAEDFVDFSLDRLQEASFEDVSQDDEIDFIEVVLAKASVLLTLHVKPGWWTTREERFEILKKLNAFRRASSQVQVIYMEAGYGYTR